jgi:hypothetical protein
MKNTLQDWEQNHVNAITLRLILSSAAGTLGATLVAFIMKKAGLGEIKPELLFLPWGIALVYGTSMSFHAGVMAERERLAKVAEEEKKK